MKLHTVARTLTAVVWLIWIASTQAKKLAPALFGTPSVQWTCAAIVAVLVPVVALLSFRMLYGQQHRRAALGLLILACSPLVANLTALGAGGALVARTNMALLRMHEGGIQAVSTLSDQAISRDNAEDRSKSAGALYSMFGIQAVWKNENGELEYYQPTEKQQARWDSTFESEQQLRNSMDLLESQLKQMPWLFLLNLFSFCLVFVSGLCWWVYRSKSEQAEDGDASQRPC